MKWTACNTPCIYLICCFESGSDELYEGVSFPDDAVDRRKLGIKRNVTQGLNRIVYLATD